MNTFIRFFLQYLADAGTLVNATGNYVNAYTGATESFAGNNTLAPELKTFYDTELLENARVETYYAQFAKKQPLPAGRGKTVEWRKWNSFERADKLQEGVIPQGQRLGMTTITGSIDQFGTYASITDQLELHAYDDVILGATEEMGASLAETQEALIRDTLLTGTNVLYADNIDDDDGSYVSTPTTQWEMRNVPGTAVSRITGDVVNKAMTKLKKDRVPMINGKYYAVIHPSVAYDLRSDPAWIDAHKYAAPEQIFNGEIGELHGVRFIENTFAPVLVGADLSAASRFLSVTAYATNGTAGTPLTDTNDGGETSAVFVTVSEAVTGELVGRVVNCIDATNATTEASAVLNGTVVIVGVDASSKYVYFDAAPTTGLANGDFLLPGEGAKEYKGGDQNAAYATFFFGKDAFGIIDPDGGAAEMIVHDKSEIGGPLNQFSTVGYKFETNGATILYPERMLRVMSTSAYSATDESNVYDN